MVNIPDEGDKMPILEVTKKLLFTCKRHRDVTEKLMNKMGVHRSQYHLLMYLSLNPGVSQTQIAECLQVSAATVTVSIKKLEKNGYVQKVTNGEDNRFNQIKITEKGMKAVETAKAIVKEIEEQTFKDFTEEELIQFGNYMDRMYHNLNELLIERSR